MKQSREIIKRLTKGKTLRDLGLGEEDGRVDLRAFDWSPPTTTRASRFQSWRVHQTTGNLELRGVRLESLDFSWSHIESPAVFTSVVRNCRFDHARLRGLRMWAVDVEDASFENADLRDTVLGGTVDGRWNTFRRVRFDEADLRGTTTPQAGFEACDFSRARLDNVEFESDFINCRFAGPLEQVAFRSRSSMPGGRDGIRRLVNVDFTDAEFHWVDFRGFDLDSVRFPAGPGHVIVEPFRCTLEHAVRALKATNKYPGLVAMLEMTLANAGPNQLLGVFDTRALREAADQLDEPVEEFLYDAMRNCSGIVA